MNIVELFARVHVLTGKFPKFSKVEAQELKELMKVLNESMDEDWKKNHFQAGKGCSE